MVLTQAGRNDPARTERQFRRELACQAFANPLEEIAKNHSIPVMDSECRRFLRELPPNATLLDIGGSWGWHWRKIRDDAARPRVILLDFVSENFSQAKVILGPGYRRSVTPLGGDARNLPFGDNSFEAVWTVQTFQHIRDFARACREAWRVLKPGGQFINYSLHAPVALRLLYQIRGKKFHQKGEVPGRFYLRRADAEQKKTVETIFRGPVEERFTECLFHPDLRLTFSGREGSWLGTLDAQLGAFPCLGTLIARQRSFFAVK
jgi:ubiquinone/menaquinone biosynthesis C-methylase UbiE